MEMDIDTLWYIAALIVCLIGASVMQFFDDGVDDFGKFIGVFGVFPLLNLPVALILIIFAVSLLIYGIIIAPKKIWDKVKGEN